MKRQFVTVALTAVATVSSHTSSLSAQAVEITPFAGYRFGGGFFELLTAQPIDLDGTFALGAVLNVQLTEGVRFEGLYSHQRAELIVPAGFGPQARVEVNVDHWLGGALQEFGRGRARPFVTGLIGLTRYASETDSEIRLAASAGGGVKLLPANRVGVRLDGRVLATLVDADGTVYACVVGGCLLALHADVVWQAEFTAGVVIRFR
jgi:hypothetical protein